MTDEGIRPMTDEEIDDILTRRDFLYFCHARCARCGSDQVQIIRVLPKPATWACRECKYQFDYEPGL